VKSVLISNYEEGRGIETHYRVHYADQHVSSIKSASIQHPSPYSKLGKTEAEEGRKEMMKEKDDELELITRVQARRTVFFLPGTAWSGSR